MEARLFWMLRMAVWLAVAVGADTLLAAAEPDPQYWRKTTFALSFKAPQPGHDQPQEIDLHVSSDHGQTWAPYAQSPPDQTRFVFKAPRDGEYWFMLRTKFTSGKYLPTGRPAAEIKVVVDTVPPTLTLDAREGQGGEVHLHWKATDPNLSPDALRLEYKTIEPGSTWQRVALERPMTNPGQTEYVGDTTIVPLLVGNEHSLIVRADIADKAGNHTAREQPLQLSKGRLAPSTAAGETLEERPPQMQANFPQRSSAAGAVREDRTYPALDSSDHLLSPHAPQPEASLGADEGDPSPPGRTAPPFAPATDADSPGPAITLPHDSAFTPQSVHPPVTRRIDENAASGAETNLLDDIRPHMVNRQRFELVYEIDSVGSAGIAEVELWCTEDGGQTWNSFGIDDDCRSPMLVTVDGEGVYGFRVVATTTSGLRSPAPAAGEPPDIWVAVDLTPPEAKLISARQGKGDEADQLEIVWEATDERLAARPIALRYREKPEGPWLTIASGLENTGRYGWRLDQRLPAEVYLQMEVRDEAGNITTAELPDAVSLRQVRPQSRIRDVHPVGALPPASGRRVPR